MDVPRVRNIGWSPWVPLLFLVSLVGIVVQLLLFIIPSKSQINQAEQGEKERIPVARRENHLGSRRSVGMVAEYLER